MPSPSMHSTHPVPSISPFQYFSRSLFFNALVLFAASSLPGWCRLSHVWFLCSAPTHRPSVQPHSQIYWTLSHCATSCAPRFPSPRPHAQHHQPPLSCHQRYENPLDGRQHRTNVAYVPHCPSHGATVPESLRYDL
ncbi:hypothetical protein CPB85DRAFT_1267035 [Mucidula mucida]|nr:hypothetical protein CPB85DRAFT_1267035 [Mucidula mucida]